MTASDPAAQANFSDSISQYRKSSAVHAKSARQYSIFISLLILVGLLIIIGLPYLLSWADRYFKSSISLDAVENKITRIELRIENSILATPEFLTLQVFTNTDSSDLIYYPGLTPLSPAVFSDSDIGVITGSDGLIAVSTNDGETWRQVTSNTLANLQPPVFLGENKGFISGTDGTLLVTNDGGESWLRQDYPVSGDLNPAVIGNDSTAVITGENGVILIWQSDNNEWLLLPEITKENLNSPVFNGSLGIITGDKGTLLVSEDSGVSWQKVELATQNNVQPATISANGTVIFSTDEGQIFTSKDKGEHFEEYNFPTGFSASNAVFFGGNGVIAGEEGLILTSQDNGYSWRQLTTQVSADLLPPVFSKKSIGVISGDDGVLMTSNDAGKTWSNLNTNVPTDLLAPVFEGNVGVISGDEGALFVSNNAGKSWDAIVTGVPSDLQPAVFTDSGLIVVSGDDGTLLVSSDRGKTWADQNAGVLTDLQSPVYSDNGTGVISGYGSIYIIKNISKILDEDRLSDLVELLESSTKNVQADILKQLGDQKYLLEEFKTTLVDFDKNEVNDRLEKSLIRGSALAVIMFLIQVLVSNYRYNLKLSSFYLSRAQAFEVIAELGPDKFSADDLNVVMTMLTPQADFSKGTTDGNLNSAMSIIDKLRKG